MANAHYIKGRRCEYQCRNALRKVGYAAERSAGSAGLFDVWGVHRTGRDAVFVQVKSGDCPAPGDYAEAAAQIMPAGCIALVVWYQERAKARVLYCSGEVPEWARRLWEVGKLPRQANLLTARHFAAAG